MTRQQQITLQQARYKRDDARRRVDDAIKKCMTAVSNEEYSALIDDACRASSDYNTWCTVVEALERL